jgi:hypothetical protein
MILKAVAYFLVAMFALIGVLTTTLYLYASIALGEFRSVRVGWQTIIPCIVLGALFVAYKTRKRVVNNGEVYRPRPSLFRNAIPSERIHKTRQVSPAQNSRSI